MARPTNLAKQDMIIWKITKERGVILVKYDCTTQTALFVGLNPRFSVCSITIIKLVMEF